MCRAVPIRLFVDADLAAGAEVALAPEQADYAGNVRRRAAGDEVLLFNGRDGEWLARIGSLGKGQATLAVRSRTRAQQAGSDLWLVFAPIKRARLAFIAEKATELGVSALLPILTQRTIVTRLNAAALRANVVEAAEQCGRLDVPEVREPAGLADLLAGWPAERRLLVCDETGGGKPIAAALAAEAGAGPAGTKPPGNGPAGAPWAVMIGPEGGYAPDELDALAKLPFVTRVGLGPLVLQADTAAVAALACWQAVAGAWK